mmetsp:Transcript_14623/g.32268  ORF Transcript_14623/g.32268 Transcript_14623/m.32268 type:complete len:87 (+) Transcript_14623:195-455(+)
MVGDPPSWRCVASLHQVVECSCFELPGHCVCCKHSVQKKDFGPACPGGWDERTQVVFPYGPLDNRSVVPSLAPPVAPGAHHPNFHW